MSDKEIRLECLRIAGGNIDKAKAMYAFVTEQTEDQVVVASSWVVPAPTRWIYSDGTRG